MATSNDSSEKIGSGDEVEYQQGSLVERPTYGQKLKRHCARFWWLHLLIFCVVFLIIALCLVYVAMPRIAQHDVNASYLEFTELDFLNPTPDSVEMTQKGILHNPHMYTPTLDPFNASCYLVTDGKRGPEPIIYIPMPRIHALHPNTNVSLDATVVPIANMDQLTAYATAILSYENVTTELSGRPRLHEGKLPVITVNYNSQSTYKGLNGLAGFNVTGLRINTSATTGPNLIGYAYIPNPSVLTIAMGNVTLNLATAKSGIIGNSTILNMTLKPGNNTLPMTGILNQELVIASLDSKGFLNMTITGKDAIYNGEHLTYYEKALSSNALSLELNVMQILKDSA